ncbi:flagellar hook-length control protein FliK [Pseudidiomarina woesei]|uniref:Flagellar hook-length control protein FliK n=1 Tax=Pseudidiomarina woesei TaxID=1381080 RepID=A0A0K6HC48_9GAMM|nr:flagellar hook-length control protein FliK [Pseudidiomarina woesei]CUA88560.1 Flagellar hook-length control protein FliK [Pseudidiomarina woesei]
MMVNFNNLVNTAPGANKGSVNASEGATPSQGFAALFAALQPQTDHLNQAPTQAQLQQIAKNLNANEQEQLLEQADLSPETIALIVAQLQQQQAIQQPQVAAEQPTATLPQVAESSKARNVAANLATQSQAQASSATVGQQTIENTAPLTAGPLLSGKITETAKQAQPPVFTTPVAPRNPEQTDARVASTTWVADLKPVDQITPIDSTRPAQVTTATMTTSVIMIDAPVAQSAPSTQAIPATPSTTVTTASLAAPVGSQAWANQLQQNVLQMVMHNQNEMTLRLHPAELGPLQVQLRMDDTTAQLNILTHSQQVRGALEHALPTLREALANQGIQLGESNVNDQGQQFAQQQARQQAQQWAANAQNNAQNFDENTVESSESAENTDMGENSRHTAAALNGQVDTFA